MDLLLYYIIVISITMELQQPCLSNPIRKTRIATDKEDVDSSRKIVPKSIFIAPKFRCPPDQIQINDGPCVYKCPPDYILSNDGRCLFVVQFIENYQQYSILSRLNYLFANEPEIFLRSKKDNRQNSGEITESNPINSPSQEYQIHRPIRKKHRTDTEGPVRMRLPMI